MARKKHSPEQRQQPKGTSIVGEGTDKVVAPDVIRMFRTKPHARTVVQPQPASWLLLRRHFQPFPPPDPLHPDRRVYPEVSGTAGRTTAEQLRSDRNVGGRDAGARRRN